jgi:hypothetical protein
MIPASSNRSVNRTADDDDEIIAVNRYGEPSRNGVAERYHDEEAEPEQPRYKYSSHQMARGNNGRDRCRKWCCVVLLFLLFVGFSVGLSLLINYLFFREDESSSNDSAQPINLANETFVHDKTTVDAACSPSTFNQDGGAQCTEVCEPQFSSCCKPFLDVNIMTNTTVNTTNATNTTSTDTTRSGDKRNAASAEGHCSLETESRGCVSYSKCIAASGFDPAPTALPMYCAPSALEKDPQSCESLCDKNRCCYNQDGMHCLGDKLDVCMDYAPCQNLRTEKEALLLEPAPANLDQLCFYDAPECHAACKKAECCNLNATSTNVTASSSSLSCLADNIVSCLTYAACELSNKTSTKISLPPQFSVLPKLPAEVAIACDERGQDAVVTTEQTCEQHCNVSACCTASENNCFDRDPLGCLAWDRYCQVTRNQLGSPP